MDALASVEILIPNGEMSPNKPGNGQVPSISYSSVQSLGVGDPISHVSSAYSNCNNSVGVFVKSVRVAYLKTCNFTFRAEAIKALHIIHAHILHKTVLLIRKMGIHRSSTFFRHLILVK